MFVLGIDPGLTRCGFGAVRRVDARRTVAVDHGVLRTPVDAPLPDRLADLHGQLAALMERHFARRRGRRARLLPGQRADRHARRQASGLALALAASRGCEVVQYTANEVKLAVTGYGAADKRACRRWCSACWGWTALRPPPTPPMRSPSRSATPPPGRAVSAWERPVAVPVRRAPSRRGGWRRRWAASRSRCGGRRDRAAPRHRRRPQPQGRGHRRRQRRRVPRVGDDRRPRVAQRRRVHHAARPHPRARGRARAVRVSHARRAHLLRGPDRHPRRRPVAGAGHPVRAQPGAAPCRRRRR